MGKRGTSRVLWDRGPIAGVEKNEKESDDKEKKRGEKKDMGSEPVAWVDVFLGGEAHCVDPSHRVGGGLT